MSRNRISMLGMILMLFAAPLFADSFGDPVRGQRLFVQKDCVECHAVRGAGGRVGPDLGRTSTKNSFYDIAAAIWNHSPQMSEKIVEWRLKRPTFEETELSDLIAFLYFLNYFDEPGDVTRGKTIFAEKHCIECHAIGREGGRTGPRLDGIDRATSPLQIAEGLWNHGPTMVASIRARNLQVPTFNGNEIIDLFAFLRDQGRGHVQREFRSAGDPERGRELFVSKKCSQCHSVFGRGGDLGPDLGEEELRGSVTQLAGRMWNHLLPMADAMQAMGMTTPKFREGELADLFAYLFISRYDGAAADTEHGLEVFDEKGCSSCHGAGGSGTPRGPALREITAGESKEEIAQRMWNHAPRMWEQIRDQKMIWPYIAPNDLADLLRYLSEWPDSSAAAVSPN